MASIPRSIIGHEKQVAQLIADIESDNVAHAYLFSGPRHLGKFAVARWFAWQLLSSDVDDDQKEKVRDEVVRLVHPDILSLDDLWMEGKLDNWDVIAKTSNVPQEHRAKKKVKSDTISIDDIRALQERLYETASSRYVCCLIRSLERMQDPASNAFLKLLEEPPPRVVFLLTTQMQHSLLPTLVSRARVLLFSPLMPQQFASLLGDLSSEESSFVLHLAQGAPGHVMRLVENPDLLRQEKQLHAQAKRFWQSNLHERLQWLQSFQSTATELGPLLLHLGLTLREIDQEELAAQRHRAYMHLVSGSRTNVHRGLLLQQFALAVS